MFLRIAITPYKNPDIKTFRAWLKGVQNKRATHLLLRFPELNEGILEQAIASGILVILHGKHLREKLPDNLAGIHFNRENLARSKDAPTNLLRTYSAHSLREIEELSFDYYFLSPVFPTASHPKTQPLGLEILEKVQKKHKIICLGGITTEERIKQCQEKGVGGFASIRYFH